jgi:hypothetical protein
MHTSVLKQFEAHEKETFSLQPLSLMGKVGKKLAKAGYQCSKLTPLLS